MFQLQNLNRELIPGLLASTAPDDALERRADRLIFRLREARAAQARGLPARLAVTLDRWLRSEAPEFLDRDDVSAADKVAIVSRLDRLNRRLHAYRRFLAVLRPGIEAVHRREGRPGSGGRRAGAG